MKAKYLFTVAGFLSANNESRSLVTLVGVTLDIKKFDTKKVNDKFYKIVKEHTM
tara:strand:- start:16 stop:177 length:162 start_codon:yes stop_codon:yes gene_type:complete